MFMPHRTLLNKNMFTPLGNLLYKLFRYVLLLGISYVALFPIIKMVSASLSTPEDYFSDSSSFLPVNPTFDNFKNSQSYFPILKPLKVTLIVTVSCTLVSVFICSLVGYGLGRYKFKGSNLVYAAVLFTIIMPIQTAQIPLVYYYRWFDFFGIGKIIGLFTGKDLTVNLLTNVSSLLVPALFGVGLNAGIFIFLFRQFFSGMSKDLEEAAKLDGCSPFKIYWRVMLPNIIPVMVTVLLLSTIYYWNDSLVTGMLNLDIGNTLMVDVQKMISTHVGASELTYMRMKVEYFSILTLSVLPLVAVFIFCQKFFVECMDRSGSKG